MKCQYEKLPYKFSNQLNLLVKNLLNLNPDQRPSINEILGKNIYYKGYFIKKIIRIFNFKRSLKKI